MSLGRLWESATHYLRTNRTRVIFMSIAGVGVAATGIFLHGQYRRMHEFMDEQRAAGARALRGVFLANSQTVQSALNALLPLARERIKEGPGIEAEQLVLLLRDPGLDKAKRLNLWERLKVSTFVEFIGATYVVATLHAVLSLQVNLLSRYGRVDENAPVELLPSHTLQVDTKNAYLAKVREQVLSASFVNPVLAALHQIVPTELEEVPLKKRLGKQDISRLACRICEKINSEELDELSGNWLFAVQDAHDSDVDLKALVDESLDLANELDISSVIHRSTLFIIDCMLERITGEEWGDNQAIPCAQLLASLHRIGNELLENAPESIHREPNGQHFAASVLISGERDSAEPIRSV